MAQGLTVLAAIRPGQDARLRAVLRPIGDDIRGSRMSDSVQRPHIDFSLSRAIHFARFAILDDPDRGPNDTRLLYSSNHDGDLDQHIRELLDSTSNMDAIWGCCEGYTGAAQFAAFIRAHRCEPEAFYIAFRGETVVRIQRAIERRRQIESASDSVPTNASQPAPASPTTARPAVIAALDSVGSAFARLLRALPIVVDLLTAIVRHGFSNVLLGARRITATLDRYPLLRWFNRLTANRLAPRRTAYSSATLDQCAIPVPRIPGDEFPRRSEQMPPAFREDVVAQNQLTVITVVRPDHVDRVRAVMSAIDSYAKRLAPDGSLLGISTIHFVRWLLLDHGRRLMMVSDYDGSWEAYIDEFAELILSGLDAIWETSYGYPPDGARDLPAFKQFLRNHQVPAEVFFSGYPDETVLNVISDRALARRVGMFAAPGRSSRPLPQV